MIDLAKRMIKRHEGLRLKPYRCTADKLTIGYGRNLEARGITEDEAYILLENDISRVLQQLQTLDFWPDLDDVRQAVLVDMCFNLGFSGLLRFRKMVDALKDGDYVKASVEMVDSRWYRQVGQRAETLVEMMRTGNADRFT